MNQKQIELENEQKDYLIIQDGDHEFHDCEGLLRVVGRISGESPTISYCRHVGFRFVVPTGLINLKQEFGDGLEVVARYVDESNRWGKYYSPRKFVVGNRRINLHHSNNQYLSEVGMRVENLRKKLEQSKFGKREINLIDELNLDRILTALEENVDGNAGEIAAAWDYYLLMNGFDQDYAFDKYDPEKGVVDHNVSCFAGIPIIYIPLNKLMKDEKAFKNGVVYLKKKFVDAKKENILSEEDARAIIIEADPKPQYKFM